jgi:kumamolisin
LDVTVYLRPVNNQLQHFIHDVVAGNRDPLTRQEYEREFGASVEDIESMRNFSREHHLQVTQVNQAARSMVLSGSVKDMCAAFQAKIDHYDVKKGGTSYSHRFQSGALSVPETYADVIKGVFGFDNRPNARSLFHRRSATDQASGHRSFYPNEVAQLYNFPTQSNQNNGAGQTIGIIELGGGYSSDKLSEYFSSRGIFPPPRCYRSIRSWRLKLTLT